MLHARDIFIIFLLVGGDDIPSQLHAEYTNIF